MAKTKATEKTKKESMTVEVYGLVRDGENFRVATYTITDGKLVSSTYSNPYWHVEAVRKFKIKAGKMFRSVQKESGKHYLKLSGKE